MAELPVLEVVSTTHLVCDVTLGLGKVAYDYLPGNSGAPRLGSALEAVRMMRAMQ